MPKICKALFKKGIFLKSLGCHWEPIKNYLAIFFRLGDTLPTPLAENHFAKKPLAEMGVAPPPFKENRGKFS